jgi:hypothetical protein
LQACKALDANPEEQQRVLKIMEAYSLRPISLAAEGTDESALTHADNLKNCNDTKLDISVIPPPKKQRKDAENMVISPNASLYSSTVSGPYRERFLKNNYVELSDQVSIFLNQDWLLRPQMRFACSRLLVGSILLLPSSGESIVINSAEIHGRTRSVDSHRESFKARKGASMRNSYPPESTTYSNIWPTTINDTDGNKLMIGSKTFNILVTSITLGERCLTIPTLTPLASFWVKINFFGNHLVINFFEIVSF